MPFYNDLRPDSDHKKKDYALIFPGMAKSEKVRTIDGILALKASFEKQGIPQRKTDENLLVASWNIREFGGQASRLPESYFYMAEIIARFDLVVLQEVTDNLESLNILLRILGPQWDHIVNDSTGGSKGNSERSAFLFNRQRVQPNGTVGELVLWPEITDGFDLAQLLRTPFFIGFRAAWKNFTLLSLHLQPGDDDNEVGIRHAEVVMLLNALAEKSKGKERWLERLVICGDFNFYESEDGPAIDAFHQHDYFEPDGLSGKNTTAAGSHRYDRMFIRENEYFTLAKDDQGKTVGGVFDPFEAVFREDQVDVYKPLMKDKHQSKQGDELLSYYNIYYKTWQLSDHLPIWFELETDSSEQFLREKRGGLIG